MTLLTLSIIVSLLMVKDDYWIKTNFPVIVLLRDVLVMLSDIIIDMRVREYETQTGPDRRHQMTPSFPIQQTITTQQSNCINLQGLCKSDFVLSDLLQDIFMGNELIPDVIDRPPLYPLDLTYKTIRTFPGMRLTADMTRSVLKEVKWRH